MQYNALAVTMCQIYWKIKRRFYSFLIECKQNFMHCHPCCLVKSNRRRMTFRSKVNTVICFVDWNDFLCCWICRFLKLSIFKFVYNVFTTSHFIETRESKKKCFRSKKITKHRPIYNKTWVFPNQNFRYRMLML